MKNLSLVFLLAFSLVAMSEDNSQTAAEEVEVSTSSETVATETAETKVVGAVDIRPSWESRVGRLYSEQLVDLGYQFNTNTKLRYFQAFDTNFYNPNPGDTGLNPIAQDGRIQLDLSNLMRSSDEATSFSYQNRVYLPTNTKKRDAGMITAIRNYLMLSQKVSNEVTLSVMEIPILHFYDRAGVAASANPGFENRVYLVADVALMDGKLNVSMPLALNSTRYRDHVAGVKYNDSWGHFLWIFPEALYSVTPNMQVGLSYYSDNMLAEDATGAVTGLDIGSGLEKGITQLVLKASL